LRLAVIPARGGSKRIPRKNIRDFAGRPMIGYAIGAAREAGVFDRIVVSTDDAEIAAIAKEQGAEVPFMRPAELANDTASAIGVVEHAVASLDKIGWCAEGIIYLQPTSPFRGAPFVKDAVSLLRAGDSDTVVSVVPVPHAMTPTSLMRLTDGYLEHVAPATERRFRRQEKPLLYARNGPAILALTRATLATGDLYGPRIKPLVMPTLESHDVDEPLDLKIAEALLPLVLARRASARE
jgi:CMP-N-acetylneuraminic acid synthetase